MELTAGGTPALELTAGGTPALELTAGGTPALELTAGGTPALELTAGGTPALELTAGGTPALELTAGGTPALELTAGGTPALELTAGGTPALARAVRAYQPRAISSAGRASRLHRGGRGFESLIAHHQIKDLGRRRRATDPRQDRRLPRRPSRRSAPVKGRSRKAGLPTTSNASTERLSRVRFRELMPR